jgi:CheY-like chemotaxis protein
MVHWTVLFAPQTAPHGRKPAEGVFSPILSPTNFPALNRRLRDSFSALGPLAVYLFPKPSLSSRHGWNRPARNAFRLGDSGLGEGFGRHSSGAAGRAPPRTHRETDTLDTENTEAALARKLRSAGTARGPVASPKGAPVTSISERPRKVLVVEDVALIRMTIMDMVEQLGFAAAEAADAAEALAILQQDGEIDILLTDLGMPGMSGRQLVEETLRLKPGMKVIIASGYSHEEGGAKLPANVFYLTKPFDMQQLRRALEA